MHEQPTCQIKLYSTSSLADMTDNQPVLYNENRRESARCAFDQSKLSGCFETTTDVNKREKMHYPVGSCQIFHIKRRHSITTMTSSEKKIVKSEEKERETGIVLMTMLYSNRQKISLLDIEMRRWKTTKCSQSIGLPSRAFADNYDAFVRFGHLYWH